MRFVHFGFHLRSTAYLGLVLLLPFYLAGIVQNTFHSLFILSPLVYCLSFLAVVCGLGALHRQDIVIGKFPRDLSCPEYAARRFYGLCWTCLYYFTPLYHLVLSIPALKAIVFRSFGYKGSLNITLYPDTWIRDLPLLDFGDGVYIANRATIGTNMPLLQGKIQVNKVTIGARSLIGHLTKIGPGASIGSDTEIATDCAIGLSACIGNQVRIASCVTVHHYASVGSNTIVGGSAYIGFKSKVGCGLKIPAGTIIPDNAKVLTQADVDRYTPKHLLPVQATEGLITKPVLAESLN